MNVDFNKNFTSGFLTFEEGVSPNHKMLLVLVAAILNAASCNRLSIVVCHPLDGTMIPIDVDSEGTVRDIKHALACYPGFECPENYVLSFNDGPLADGAFLSDSGITSESRLNSQYVDADVTDLHEKGFNQTEIMYFEQTLHPHGLNVYAAFWGLDAPDEGCIHFMKRTSSNKYLHFLKTNRMWLSMDADASIEGLYNFCEVIIGYLMARDRSLAISSALNAAMSASRYWCEWMDARTHSERSN